LVPSTFVETSGGVVSGGGATTVQAACPQVRHWTTAAGDPQYYLRVVVRKGKVITAFPSGAP
jgi:hypothetical protein